MNGACWRREAWSKGPRMRPSAPVSRSLTSRRCCRGCRATPSAPASGARGLASDLDALRRALQPGVTALPEKPGGLGLFLTQVLLRQNGGGMMMRTGDAHLDVGVPPAANLGLAPMRGTLVTLRFRTDSPF